MNKTITITLNSLIFYVEEDGYNELKDYLEAIRKYYSSSDEGDEVLADIESSIAEKFAKKITNKKQVITSKDVKEVMEVMGSVDDFVEVINPEEIKGEKEKKSKKQESKSIGFEMDKEIKKLYRDPDDAIIAGVCGGLGQYFKVDPVIFRLLFVVLTFMGSAGIWIYLLLWLIIPQAKTSSQKLEMQGDKITLKKIEEVVKNKIDEVDVKKLKKNSKSGINKIISLPFVFLKSIFDALKTFMGKIIPILRVLIGFCMLLFSVFMVGVLAFTSAALLFGIDSQYITLDFPIKEIIGALTYIWGIIFGTLSILIPFVVLLILSISIIKNKKIMGLISFIIFIAVWIFSMGAISLISINSYPKIKNAYDTYVEENKVTQDYNFSSFRKVDVQGSYEVNISKGEEFSVRVSANKSSIRGVDFVESENTLTIIKKEIDYGLCVFCQDERPVIDITMPELEKLSAKSSSRIEVSEFGEYLREVELSRSAILKLDQYSDDLLIKTSGYSILNLSGEVRNLKVITSNGSEINLEDFKSSNIDLELDNYAKVYITEVEAAAEEDDLNILAKMNDYSGLKIKNTNFSLLKINADDYTKINIENDKAIQDINRKIIADLSDNSKLSATDVKMGDLELALNKTSKVSIEGTGGKIKAVLKKASRLEAIDFLVDEADIHTFDNARALVEPLELLKARAENASKVFYRGEMIIESEELDNSVITKYQK